MPSPVTSPQPTTWHPAPKTVDLKPDTIQLFLTSLTRPQAQIDHLHSLLSADEQARAARFKFDIHRNQFIVSQGTLRSLLAKIAPLQAQNVAASAIEFVFNDHRKPALAPSCAIKDFAFNLSHSGDLALYGFTLAPTIGVDIEIIRPDFGGLDIAKRFFSADEVKQLLATPKAEQARNFFRIWTAKEAFIKAVGEGLSYPLADFSVRLGVDNQMTMASIKGATKTAKTWHMHAFTPQKGYISCLALPCMISRFNYYKV